MKIQYKFATETISIDVPDDWGEILIDLDRQEYNNDHKETRRHYSLEGKVYEGMDYAVEDPGLEALFAGPTDEERLRAAIQKLDPDQQAMIRAIYFEGVSVNDYAARMGVTQSAIGRSLFPLWAEQVFCRSGLSPSPHPAPGRRKRPRYALRPGPPASAPPPAYDTFWLAPALPADSCIRTAAYTGCSRSSPC